MPIPSQTPPARGIVRALFVVLLGFSVHAETIVHINTEPDSRDAARFLGAAVYFSDLDVSEHPDWLDKVIPMHLRLLRYPGGQVANYWDWRRGNLVAEGIPTRPRLTERHPDFSLAQFARLTQQCDATPVFCLNLLTDTLDSQIEMLKTAHDLGLPIRYVELGNELNSNHPGYRERFPDGNAYGRTAAEWITAISEHFPNARFGVVAGGPHPWRKRPWREWNDAVLAWATNAHAIIVHPYLRSEWVLPGVVQRGATPSITTLQRQAALLEQADTQRAFLGMAPHRMEDFAQLTAAHPNHAVWVTEFNLADRLTPAGGSWLHALVIAQYVLQLLEQPQIEMALYYQVSGTRSYSAVYHRAWPRPWLADATVPFEYTAPGAVLALYGQLLHERPMARRLTFDPNPSWPRQPRRGRADYDALIGYRLDAASSETDPRWIIANLSPAPYQPAWTDAPESVVPERVLFGRPADQTFVDQLVPAKPYILPPFSLTVWKLGNPDDAIP